MIASARLNPIVITNTASLRRARFGFGIMDNAKKPPDNIKRPVRNGSSIFTFTLSNKFRVSLAVLVIVLLGLVCGRNAVLQQ